MDHPNAGTKDSTSEKELTTEELIISFMEKTESTRTTAVTYLQESRFNLDIAVNHYFEVVFSEVNSYFNELIDENDDGQSETQAHDAPAVVNSEDPADKTEVLSAKNLQPPPSTTGKVQVITPYMLQKMGYDKPWIPRIVSPVGTEFKDRPPPVLEPAVERDEPTVQADEPAGEVEVEEQLDVDPSVRGQGRERLTVRQGKRH